MKTSNFENINRIKLLRKTAQVFVEKSLNCTKIADVQAFFDLATQANANADALESEFKVESCWVYLHFVKTCGYPPAFSSYLEFCVRNGLSPVVKADFSKAYSFLLLQEEGSQEGGEH